MALPVILLLPFIGALIAPLVNRWGSRRGSAIAAVIPPLAAIALLLVQLPAVRAGQVPTWDHPWLPALGLDLVIRLDGLALLFALLVFGIGVLVIVYARYYLDADDSIGRLYAFLLLFMGSMAALVLAGNLLLIAVCWELTTLSSFLCIGYWSHRADARQGARVSLTITGIGGFALLGGVILLGKAAGSFDLATVLAAGERVRQHELYLPALVLILVAAFTKSAQLPFHFWLPAAMAAPTPVSAYLHSATMVKAGVFLLARLHPVLSGTDPWLWMVSGTGLATFVFGGYAAQFRNDMKGVLAYSTVSHLGLITMLLGLSSPIATVAAVFHVMNHATFKASLFMASGIVDHETGTRDLRVLNGLWRHMPYTTALAVVAAAAMAGVPLLNGFLSKEMFFSEALQIRNGTALSWIVPVLATLGGAFSVSYSVRFIHQAFFSGPGTGMPRVPHEPPRFMRVPVEVLALLCVLVGVMPAVFVEPLLSIGAGAVVGGPLPPFSLAIWHGFTLPLAMTVIAFVGGITAYRLLMPRLEGARQPILPVVRAASVYHSIRMAVIGGAARTTAALETGSLQRYLLLVVLSALVAGAWPVARALLAPGAAPTPTRMPLTPVDFPSVAVWLLLMTATLGVLRFYHDRFIALVLVGGVGLSVSLAFVHFAAPDLALTQLLVEVVTVILLILALYHMPRTTERFSSDGRRWRDALVAVAAGLGAGGLAWAMLTRPVTSTLADYFLRESLPLGGGTNVVNVILVDFRGFDTMGEISVMGIAAIGVAGLLAGLRPRPSPIPTRLKARDRHPLLLATVSRPLLPLALLVAIFILLRGHNQPGGGFIAAILTSAALILQYMASGVAWTRQRLRLNFQPFIALGVLLAVLTGAGAWLFGVPFMSMTFTHLHIPIIGDIELATAMIFDLGVYVAVVGAVMLILARLGKLSHGGEADAAFREEADPWKC
ncbi:MAG: monovalent cation/H+ antiporter subunit A [Gemmatimonadaceae bacterium]